jgi:hypothetical protein
MYGGKIYQDSRGEYRDGHRFFTAYVKETLDRGDYLLVKTFNNSQFLLYKKYENISKRGTEDV